MLKNRVVEHVLDKKFGFCTDTNLAVSRVVFKDDGKEIMIPTGELNLVLFKPAGEDVVGEFPQGPALVHYKDRFSITPHQTVIQYTTNMYGLTQGFTRLTPDGLQLSELLHATDNNLSFAVKAKPQAHNVYRNARLEAAHPDLYGRFLALTPDNKMLVEAPNGNGQWRQFFMNVADAFGVVVARITSGGTLVCEDDGRVLSQAGSGSWAQLVSESGINENRYIVYHSSAGQCSIKKSHAEWCVEDLSPEHQWVFDWKKRKLPFQNGDLVVVRNTDAIHKVNFQQGGSVQTTTGDWLLADDLKQLFFARSWCDSGVITYARSNSRVEHRRFVEWQAAVDYYTRRNARLMSISRICSDFGAVLAETSNKNVNWMPWSKAPGWFVNDLSSAKL